MLPKPHGGKLVHRLLRGVEGERALKKAAHLSRLELTAEVVREVMNIAVGVFSPLEGFMGAGDLKAVLANGRLANGIPWTIPIILDVSMDEAPRVGTEVTLTYQGDPFAILVAHEIYPYDKDALAWGVYGTADPRHPGVAKVRNLKDRLIGGSIAIFKELESAFGKYSLRPMETRFLFETKGWRTVVGFQTRNVPHMGHEYIQKTALSFVDGIFINPVIGKKKPGDFKDDVILAAYEALLENYYLKDRAVMAILETEMRYAGPREAIFHAILRKNFGCTHFIVGRDHAGVGDFYPPYAAQEVFDRYPDLGITPLFFTAFFYCKRCGGVVNEKTCPHGREEHIAFSGTELRQALERGGTDVISLIRPEVAEAITRFEAPLLSC